MWKKVKRKPIFTIGQQLWWALLEQLVLLPLSAEDREAQEGCLICPWCNWWQNFPWLMLKCQLTTKDTCPMAETRIHYFHPQVTLVTFPKNFESQWIPLSSWLRRWKSVPRAQSCNHLLLWRATITKALCVCTAMCCDCILSSHPHGDPLR